MNSDQLKSFITAIRFDCDIVGANVDAKGRTCAIGGMARFIGADFEAVGFVTFETIAEREAYYDHGGVDRRVDNFLDIDEQLQEDIREVFGLSTLQIREIQVINDHTPNVIDRREKIFGQMATWFETDYIKPEGMTRWDAVYELQDAKSRVKSDVQEYLTKLEDRVTELETELLRVT